MKQFIWCYAFTTLFLQLCFVNSHEGRKAKDHPHPDSPHGGGASFHHSAHHRKHEEKGHGAGTLTTQDEQEHQQLFENQTLEIEPKLWSLRFLDNGFFKPKPEKLLVFNDDRYEPWSDWSECILRECIEVRYRKCKDDSWTSQIPSKIHTTNCLSKYYSEKRSCRNKTACNLHIVPQQLSEKCGIKPNSEQYTAKIVGGQVAVPHSWPWAVLLSLKARGYQRMSFCSGTLIAPQWVLTAAHCLLVENKRMPIGQFVHLRDRMSAALYVHFGEHDKTQKEPAQQDIRVEKAIIHPGYHREIISDGNDIALLYLTTPVKLTPEVGYACLPSDDVRLEPGTKCYAVGWGNTEPNRAPTFEDISSIFDGMFPQDMGIPSPFFGKPFGFSPFFRRSTRRKQAADKLMEVDLPIVGIEKCRKFYPDLKDGLHLCAGSKGKDTCPGDSGGGLYCKHPKSERWFAAGVTSYGLTRGCGNNPGVYTSVPGHLDWITKVMGSSVY